MDRHLSARDRDQRAHIPRNFPFPITRGGPLTATRSARDLLRGEFRRLDPAITVNSPATLRPSATAFRRLSLAQRGEAGGALGCPVGGSDIGGILSLIVANHRRAVLRGRATTSNAGVFRIAVCGLSMVAMTGGDSAQET